MRYEISKFATTIFPTNWSSGEILILDESEVSAPGPIFFILYVSVNMLYVHIWQLINNILESIHLRFITKFTDCPDLSWLTQKHAKYYKTFRTEDSIFHDLHPQSWMIFDTVCLRSSDPIYIITYYIKWSLLLGHTVYSSCKRGPELLPDIWYSFHYKKWI